MFDRLRLTNENFPIHFSVLFLVCFRSSNESCFFIQQSSIARTMALPCAPPSNAFVALFERFLQLETIELHENIVDEFQNIVNDLLDVLEKHSIHHLPAWEYLLHRIHELTIQFGPICYCPNKKLIKEKNSLHTSQQDTGVRTKKTLVSSETTILDVHNGANGCDNESAGAKSRPKSEQIPYICFAKLPDQVHEELRAIHEAVDMQYALYEQPHYTARKILLTLLIPICKKLQLQMPHEVHTIEKRCTNAEWDKVLPGSLLLLQRMLAVCPRESQLQKSLLSMNVPIFLIKLLSVSAVIPSNVRCNCISLLKLCIRGQVEYTSFLVAIQTSASRLLDFDPVCHFDIWR